jgi:two-component system, LuxR family, response regulator FixJ
MTADRQVYLVDDDDAIRRSAGFMLKTSGFLVETFPSGVDFLKVAHGLDAGCVLLDVRMPEIDGLAVQAEMKEHGIALPVIVMTGHGDVTVAVAAKKAEMLGALEDGFALIERSGHGVERMAMAVIRLAALTPRERDVLHGLVHGLPNKTIAYNLGISPRTVEIHRAHLMTKLDVRSLSEALRIAFSAGWSELTGKEVGTIT